MSVCSTAARDLIGAASVGSVPDACSAQWSQFRSFTMISRFYPVLVFSFTLLVSAFFSPISAGANDGQETLPQENLNIRTTDNDLTFVVEVAATDLQRARGLMFREEMAEDHGMLFIFEGEGERFFWMKNTPLPLDIIYISTAGRIVSIAEDTTPFSEAVIPSGEPARFVLELNAGTSRNLAIAVGDQVTSPSMHVE